MRQTRLEFQQPFVFRDMTTGLVWQVIKRDTTGAIYQDIKYKAQLRLTEPTLRELLRVGRFVSVVVQPNFEPDRSALPSAA